MKPVELDPEASVQREHLLIKVKVENGTRSQILEAVTLFLILHVYILPTYACLVNIAYAAGSPDRCALCVGRANP